MSGIVHYVKLPMDMEKFENNIVETVCGKEMHLPLDNPRAETYTVVAPYLVTCHKCEGILLTEPEFNTEKEKIEADWKRKSNKLSPEMQFWGMVAGDILKYGLIIGAVIAILALLFCH